MSNQAMSGKFLQEYFKRDVRDYSRQDYGRLNYSRLSPEEMAIIYGIVEGVEGEKFKEVVESSRIRDQGNTTEESKRNGIPEVEGELLKK